MLLRFLLTIAFFCPLCLYAQDSLLMRDGRLVSCDIRSEDSSFIYLTRFDDRKEDLILAKVLVKKIKYSNGNVVSIARPRHGNLPYNPSGVILSLSPVINFRGIGGGVTLEAPLTQNKVTIFLPVYFTALGYGSMNTRVVQIMPAVKFYPGKNLAGKARYAIGLQFLLQTGSFGQHSTSSGGTRYIDNVDVSDMGILINNSINFFPGRRLYAGIDLAPGWSLSNNGYGPLLHFNMRLGYRF